MSAVEVLRPLSAGLVDRLLQINQQQDGS